MGLQVTGTESTPIKIKGAELTLPSVYVRVEFSGYADGNTLESVFKVYLTKEAYKSENSTPLDVEFVGVGNRNTFMLEPLEVQGLDITLTKLSELFTNNGYQVQVV